MFELAIALVALVASLVALARAYKPPQARAVAALQGRVEDLEIAFADVRERVTTRERRAQMEHARQVHEAKQRQRSTAEEQAHQIIAAAAAAPPPPPVPVTKEALRAALLARRAG